MVRFLYIDEGAPVAAHLPQSQRAGRQCKAENLVHDVRIIARVYLDSGVGLAQIRHSGCVLQQYEDYLSLVEIWCYRAVRLYGEEVQKRIVLGEDQCCCKQAAPFIPFWTSGSAVVKLQRRSTDGINASRTVGERDSSLPKLHQGLQFLSRQRDQERIAPKGVSLVCPLGRDARGCVLVG